MNDEAKTSPEITDSQELAEDDDQNRADPTFKLLTQQLATELGLEILQTEFPQTLRADLVLAAPPEVRLEDTLLDFCRRFNILEFKGQEDRMDEYEFVKNEVRTDLFFLANNEASFENTLNVFVTSRLPRRFFNYMKSRKYRFRKGAGKPWQWQARVGLQEVVVIVCRDLPLEPKYYEWLIFAPADSEKWRQVVVKLAQELNFKLLEEVNLMRPKEFRAMNKEVNPYLRRNKKNRTMAIENWLEILDIQPEELLKGLKPEERLEGLKPEERLEGLKPEERLQLLKLLQEDLKNAENEDDDK